MRTGRGWRVSARGCDYDVHGQRSAGLWWPDREHDREPLPEEREAYEKAYDAWIQEHRFDEERALRLADFVAERMMYRGKTAVEMMAEEDELRRLDADQ